MLLTMHLRSKDSGRDTIMNRIQHACLLSITQLLGRITLVYAPQYAVNDSKHNTECHCRRSPSCVSYATKYLYQPPQCERLFRGTSAPVITFDDEYRDT